MKTRLLVLIIGLFAITHSAAWAQPTLTASGINPVLGESVTQFNGNYQNPGSAGANQTWDFTALAGSPGTSYDYVAPSSTANGSSFPNANIAGASGATSIRYFNATSTALENHGTYTSNIVAALSDPEDMLHFPFTMGNSYTDPWYCEYVNGGYTYYRSGSTTVTADAYGTMITPAGTFNNVLRVHFVQSFQDSTNFFGTPFVTTTVNDEYIWYQNGFHLILASTWDLTSGGSSFSGATYSSSGPVAMEEAANGSVSMTLSPNPASDRLTLQLALETNRFADVQIVNMVGQQVHTLTAVACTAGMNSLTLEVDHLPAGIYFAKVMVNGKPAATQQFVVAR